MKAPSAVIVGAGAIGGWFASLLASQGWDARLLARGRTLEAIRAHGLGVGDASYRLTASNDPAELGPADYVVIALKGQDLPPLGPSLAPLIGPGTEIVSMMNGIPWWFFDGFQGPLDGAAMQAVDPGGALKARFPAGRVIGSVVHASAFTIEPGVVKLVGADKLTFGAPDGRMSERMSALVEACTAAGVKTLASPHIRLDIWAKLWGNMTMNPLSALTRAPTGRILDDPETNRLCLEMMREMAGIGEALGLDLGMTPEDRMAITRKLGSFKTSMLQDLEAGRRLELDPLLGVLVEMADRLGRPVPFIRAVYGLARQLDVSIRTRHDPS